MQDLLRSDFHKRFMVGSAGCPCVSIVLTLGTEQIRPVIGSHNRCAIRQAFWLGNMHSGLMTALELIHV